MELIILFDIQLRQYPTRGHGGSAVAIFVTKKKQISPK